MLALFSLLCAIISLSKSTGELYIVKNSGSCPCGWTEYYNRCFIYVSTAMTWPAAQRNCMSMNANLASVHSLDEYQRIQRVIFDATKASEVTWIGGSDAQQNDVWFWIDGTRYAYENWCPGEPNNVGGNQKCLHMNFSGAKCWDDQICDFVSPSVCVRRI